MTPYRNPEQIASGALTFAIAAGCAAVSTPYLLRQGHPRAPARERSSHSTIQRRSRDAVCDFIESPESLAAARAEAQPHRRRSRLAVGRGRDGGRAARGRDRPAAPRADPDRRARAHLRPDRSPAHAGRRRRDHPARERRDPELGDRVLRRRRRPARGRRARAHAGARRAASGRPSSIARSPSSSSQPARNGTGCGTSWATTGAGSTSRISATTSARTVWALGEILSTAWIPALSGPSRPLLDALVPSLAAGRLAAYRRLHRPRARTTRPRSTRRGRHGCCSSASSTSSPAPTATRHRAGGCGSRIGSTYDNARLPQALIVGASALRRPDDVALGLEALAWLGDECGLDDGMSPAAGASRARPRRARARGRRRAATRRDRARRGRARGPRRRRVTPTHGVTRAERVRLVPRSQPPRSSALRLRDRRLQRRPR